VLNSYQCICNYMYLAYAGSTQVAEDAITRTMADAAQDLESKAAGMAMMRELSEPYC